MSGLAGLGLLLLRLFAQKTDLILDLAQDKAALQTTGNDVVCRIDAESRVS